MHYRIIFVSALKLLFDNLRVFPLNFSFGLNLIFTFILHTGCLMKNASTHNFFIFYPISMSGKTGDMVFHALRSSHKMFFFALFSVAGDGQLFFFDGHM
jgi:hypothetical protein